MWYRPERVGTCGTGGRAAAASPRAAAPWRPSGARSWAARAPPGPRDGRRWGREEKSAQRRARSCGGAGERCDQPFLHDFLRVDEPHAFVTPLPQQVLGRFAIDTTDRVGDDEQPRVGPALEQAFHRRLVAHVGRYAVQHDVLRVEHVDDGHHVLVREHVEAVLVEQNVTAVRADAVAQRLRIGPGRLDHERVAQRRLGDLFLPGRPPQTVRSEEHTSELQSLAYLVCRLLLEKKKKQDYAHNNVAHL